MPDPAPESFASSSLAAHLARGVLGFGLIAATLVLTPRAGAAALLLVPLGLVALRGCPTCWTVGLIQTISAGRLRRSCADGAGCTLRPVSGPLAAEGHDSSPHVSGATGRGEAPMRH